MIYKDMYCLLADGVEEVICKLLKTCEDDEIMRLCDLLIDKIEECEDMHCSQCKSAEELRNFSYKYSDLFRKREQAYKEAAQKRGLYFF